VLYKKRPYEAVRINGTLEQAERLCIELKHRVWPHYDGTRFLEGIETELQEIGKEGEWLIWDHKTIMVKKNLRGFKHE
jgi:hypothetical protein